MLFINPTASSAAAKQYHRKHLVRSDYYVKDAPEIAGHWHGLGAAALGASGAVKQEEYFRLCDNLHPLSGEQLTPRTKTHRRVAFDFTFDLPKSASLALEIGGDERILRAFRASVEETMAEVERAMCVRVRKGGADHDRVTGNMVWCDFLHRTTRPLEDHTPDPHTHIHAVAFNLSYDDMEKTWKAGQFGQIKNDAYYYQSAFHARLAKRLSALGYAVEKDGDSFRLLGIDHDTCAKFSRRTQAIEEEAERLGITDLREKSTLGRRTREGKGKEQDIDALREAWRERLTRAELSAIQTAGKGRWHAPELSPTAAMDRAIEESFERASVVEDRRLVARALVHGVGTVLPEDAHAQMARGDILTRDLNGQRYATTKAVCREELAILHFAREGRGNCAALAPGVEHLDTALSREQQNAAAFVLQSRDRVIGVRGGAGTGKTRMMQATVAAIERNGHRVFTFAPSAAASRGVLRGEGFANADTVAQLLQNNDLQRKIQGQVLWIDEAGLLSTRDMRELFHLAEARDCRVVLAGDSRQHFAVGRGDALRILESEGVVRFAQLTEVRRQTEANYKDAVSAISQGDTLARGGKTHLTLGLEKLASMGAIVEIEGDERYRRIAADYLEATGSRKHNGDVRTALVVAPTHAEAEKITGQIRAELKAKRRITGEQTLETLSPLQWTLGERKDATRYQAGMIVQFHQNAKGFTRGGRVEVMGRNAQGQVLVRRQGSTQPEILPLAAAERFQIFRKTSLAVGAGDVLRITQNGYSADMTARFDNGSTYRVLGFTREGDLKLSNGTVLPRSFGHLTHGYTSTSHASQGKTVDHVFLAMGSESLAAVNREQLYVSVSRGRESVRIYTDDKDAMLEAARRSSARLSATELLKSSPPQHTRWERGSMLHWMRTNRVSRLYDAMRTRGAKALEQIRQKRSITYGRRQ